MLQSVSERKEMYVILRSLSRGTDQIYEEPHPRHWVFHRDSNRSSPEYKTRVFLVLVAYGEFHLLSDDFYPDSSLLQGLICAEFLMF
jgi:hypothetical protein